MSDYPLPKVPGTLSLVQASEFEGTCPSCGRGAQFVEIYDMDAAYHSHFVVSLRRCSLCKALLIATQKLIEFRPVGEPHFWPKRILASNDIEHVPTVVAIPFLEAIRCHNFDCYTAAAIMVRKTLEHLCEAQGATGKNLKQQLSSLRDKVAIPPALLDGLENIRLLGNDAAHWDLVTFTSVGQKESAVALKFTRLVLNYLYQAQSVVKDFEALKKPATNPPK